MSKKPAPPSLNELSMRIGRGVASVSIELPLGAFVETQRRPDHFDFRITPEQGRKLQRLLNGLNAEYGPGWRKRDFGYADVFRWLLDQLPG